MRGTDNKDRFSFRNKIHQPAARLIGSDNRNKNSHGSIAWGHMNSCELQFEKCRVELE
jgi:hypothetical protein